MRARTLALAVSAVLLVGACSPSAPEEKQRPTAGESEQASPSSSAGASSGRFAEIDPKGTTEARLVKGVAVSLAGFKRTKDFQGEPALVFDVTLTNTTGETFDPTPVSVVVFQGPDQKEAGPVILKVDGSGSGRSAVFEKPIPDGKSATLAHGFGVDPEQEQLLIMVQPGKGEPATFLGDVPA